MFAVVDTPAALRPCCESLTGRSAVNDNSVTCPAAVTDGDSEEVGVGLAVLRDCGENGGWRWRWVIRLNVNDRTLC